MVMLTFRKEWKPKLISLEKMQTIRTNVNYWQTQFRRGQVLHIYCPNPRIRIEKDNFIGETRDWIVIPIKAKFVDDNIAQRDGFKNKLELIEYLQKHGLFWWDNLDLVIIRWFNLYTPRGIFDLHPNINLDPMDPMRGQTKL